MDLTSLIVQTTLPLVIAVGITVLAGVTTIGRERQKIKVKVRKRS